VYRTAATEDNREGCGAATPFLYSVANLRVRGAGASQDVPPSTSMRGPGATPGLYALESAMDELAIRLGIDPLTLRLINEPMLDESRGVPFSSRHLRECLQEGARRFGWMRRTAATGSMRDGDAVLGWGVAACNWGARRAAAEVRVRFTDEGMLHVQTASQDIGTGTYTVLAQMAAARTGLPFDRIAVTLGDTSLPPGPMSGGSVATGSLVPAVLDAVDDGIRQLLALAGTTDRSPYAGAGEGDIAFAVGMLHRNTMPPNAGVPFGEILKIARKREIVGNGRSDAFGRGPSSPVTFRSYGAHFVEVRWQPSIARLKVSRVVTVIDGGKIINEKTARNQIEGAIIMGIGMALFEETLYDPRSGAPINSNLADYMMTTHADAPNIDVAFLDYPDLALNPLGARGIGEIGLTGFAAAVTAAVFHATGVRVRDLPVRIEDLLVSRIGLDA
jgi:xanthine dehydrogenase YagR molybdenum-binding subunit